MESEMNNIALLSLDWCRYPESSGINYDIDATYLMDNLSGTPICSSLDILPDPTVVYEGGISVRQDGELGFPYQGLATMNSLSLSSQEMYEASFLSFLTQDMNSLSFPSQEMSEMSFLSPEMTPLEFPNHGMYMDTLEFPDEELSMLDTLSFPTQKMTSLEFPNHEMYMDTLEFPDQELSMLDALSFPTQEITSLEFPNHGIYMDTLEFPDQELSMLDALSFPTQEMTSLEFPDQGMYTNTVEFPYQTQPMIMTMGNIKEKEKSKMVSSSGCELSQKKLDYNDGNGNGKGGCESNIPLRLTLSREMISQYFYMPITDAAKELNVGITLLKKRCRELGINRWPRRKLKSLQTVITTVQEFGKSSGNGVEEKLQETIMRLENERKRMEEIPDLQLKDKTIRLREACYNAGYKKLMTIGT